VVVVDGRMAWIGGHNVGIEYLGEDPKRGPWRDTHIRIHGPAVIGAELTYATDWLWARREQLKIDWQVGRDAPGESSMLIFPSDPASDFEEAGLMYHQVITQARERIWIASPYFVPDRGIIAALQLAALRGVDVRVMIPTAPTARSWAWRTGPSRASCCPPASPCTATSRPSCTRKSFSWIANWPGVGTANFDNRSFRLNFEITALVHDEAFCDEVEKMLEDDFGRSRLVTAKELAAKPFWFPFATAAARLMAPVL
jgi:cardiolipin synthase